MMRALTACPYRLPERRDNAAQMTGKNVTMRGMMWALALLLAAPWAPPWAPAAAQAVDARTGAVLQVPLGKSQTLRVGQAFAKAVIGNEDVADVLPLSETSVYVLGRGLGATNLSLFDRGGRLIAVVDIVVGPDVQGLKATLGELLPAELVATTVSNGALVLSGTATSAAAAERVLTLAETYAPGKVVNMMTLGSVQQVLLEVKFSEMSRSTVQQLGINSFQFLNSNSGAGVVVGSPPDLSQSPYQIAVGIPNAANLLFSIDALERRGLVKTLAEPTLVALSGETAAFLAGGEFPVPVGVNLNGQVSIEFKQFGVSLAYTPTVLEDGLINLVVRPEVSQLDAAAGIELNGFRIPGLKTRRASTTVELRDGQSFALAGLIQSDFFDTVREIPLLGRIPLIGALFRSIAASKAETELVMIVTPRLVRPVPAGSLMVPTDRVLEPSDIELFIDGKASKTLPLSALPRPGGPSGDFGHIVR
ncbi:pilus assembly protein CpaC [Polymorphobacter multimanifer]|uniref:Pilus assembly protein CpaC n=1 Tax=Polymorphobacter multimanifer TaxID=1070431 RepID=A0A841L9S8_9SPHN|nr:type II and III secretion system protein family protein [Polymorphobacter multimanifer]MBB6226595.1 pilus assembly protein CpaC [Polymorphobacter multimanifer]